MNWQYCFCQLSTSPTKPLFPRNSYLPSGRELHSLHVVLTSRLRSFLPGNHPYPVHALGIPQCHLTSPNLDDFSSSLNHKVIQLLPSEFTFSQNLPWVSLHSPYRLRQQKWRTTSTLTLCCKDIGLSVPKTPEECIFLVSFSVTAFCVCFCLVLPVAQHACHRKTTDCSLGTHDRASDSTND